MEASAVPRAAPAGVSAMFSSPHLLRLATDARLVALVRERHPSAFEAVYDRHHRSILSFCRHTLGDPQEAEDAVQQTFLAAYSDLIASDKPIHLRAWLFTIARNRCYSLLRRRREQPTSDLEEPVTEGLASQVQRRQDLRDLVVDLRRLPDDQRAALVLAELDALSHEEIASVLGVPREKVKALVFQARESLVASRTARETDCAEIREQLATERGGALRRANLRRHLRECEGCREFRREIEGKRRRLAVLLPVAPTMALKEAVLGATIGGGAAAGAGAGGLMISTALKSGLAKGVLGALLAGTGAATTIVATHDLRLPTFPGAAHRQATSTSAPKSDAGAVSTTGAGTSHPGLATPFAQRAGVTTTAGVGGLPRTQAAPGPGGRAGSLVRGGRTGSFVRRTTANPFARRLGVPRTLPGGFTPRTPAPPAPSPAPVPMSGPAPSPVIIPPGHAAAPNPGLASHTAGDHRRPWAGTNPGSRHGAGSGSGSNSTSGRPGASHRTGLVMTPHRGGGDSGSGVPVRTHHGTGSSGATRSQGATGSSGTEGSGSAAVGSHDTGSAGRGGRTGHPGAGATGNPGAGATGNAGAGATGNAGPGATGNAGARAMGGSGPTGHSRASSTGSPSSSTR